MFYARPDPTALLPEAGGRWQPLEEHLREVATLARRFAETVRPNDLPFAQAAYWAGLLHDVGKYTDAFQGMLRDVICGAAKRQVEHSGHGAALLLDFGSYEAAWSVAGHHAGLPNRARLKALLTRDEFSASDRARVIDRAKWLVQAPDRRAIARRSGGVIPEPCSCRSPARVP